VEIPVVARVERQVLYCLRLRIGVADIGTVLCRVCWRGCLCGFPGIALRGGVRPTAIGRVLR
jgi:hypothetical protein